MADRSVVVRLRAEVGQYVAGLKTAASETTKFGKEVSDQGKKSSADIQRVGTVSIVAGAAVAAAFGKAVFTAADFEKQMSGVKAVSGATGDEMDRLSSAALAAGANTKLAGVTASDAAKAEEELVKAGVSVSDVLGGALMGSLTLAAAGQLEFADAATIAAQAMNIFDLNGRDVTHVADVLAAAANKSAGDVGQFGDALRQGGLVAAQTGLSLEESVGALAAFADNALVGSDAGTSLKTMLQRLTPQSKESAELMKELGFSAYDTYGNFIGLEGLAGELQSSLGDLTVEQRNSAMATLFGSDAVRGANVLYEEGARGIRDYVSAVDDEGAAARMAAIQNDNLKGDVEALGGALETALIENGSKATGALRAITQGATDLVSGFSQMPDTVQTVAVGLGGLVGAASLVTGGFITVAPKVKAASDALKEMDSAAAKFAGRNLGGLTAGLAGATAALTVGVFAYSKATEASREYKQEVADLATALAPVTEGQADLNTEMENFLKAQSEGLSDEQIRTMNAFHVSIDEVQASIARGGDALDPFRERVRRLGIDLKGVDLGKLGDKGGKAVDAERALADALGVSQGALHKLIDEMEDWDNQSQDAAKSTLESAVANDTFSQNAVDAAIAANTLKDGTINYQGALDSLAPKMQDTEEDLGDMGGAMDDAEQAASDLKDAIDKLLKPLDTRAALDQFSQGVLDMKDHFAEADAAVAEANENLADRKEALDDLLKMPKDERGEHWARQVQDARDAVADAEADIREAIEGTSRTLEGNSQAAIDNRNILDQMTRDAVDVMTAAAEDETLTVEQRAAIRDYLVKKLEDEAGAIGYNADQIGFYSDKIREIPIIPPQNVELTGVETAIAAVDRLLGRLSALTGHDMTLSVDFLQTESQLIRQNSLKKAAGGLIPSYLAAGGFPGGPRGTDTIPIWASPGEYMMQKSAVDRFGVGFMDAINAGTFSPMTAGGSASYDYSRNNHWNPTFHVAAKSPQDAAGATAFRLRRMSLEAA